MRRSAPCWACSSASGIVLLTVIQSMSSGRQAGLEGFLLGSTAGMLRQDAMIIVAGGLAGACAGLGDATADDAGAFDAEFATAAGYKVSRIDLMMMACSACRHGDRPEGRGARPDRRAVDHPAGRGAVLDRQVGA
jgi:ABC-type Mn2+/Zn2+ transport system permease subunit